MRHRFPALVVSITGIAACALLLPLPAAIREWLASPLMIEFVVGAGIAAAMRAGAFDNIPRRTGILLLLAGSISFAMSVLYDSPETFRVVSWGLPSALLVLGALIVNRTPNNAIENILLQLGAASYSIYLTHSFLTMALGTVLKRGYLADLPPLLLVLIAWPIITLGAATTYWLLEKPLLAAIRRYRNASPRPLLAEGTSS